MYSASVTWVTVVAKEKWQQMNLLSNERQRLHVEWYKLICLCHVTPLTFYAFSPSYGNGLNHSWRFDTFFFIARAFLLSKYDVLKFNLINIGVFLQLLRKYKRGQIENW